MSYTFMVCAKPVGKVRGLKLIHSLKTWPDPDSALNYATRRLQVDHTFRKLWGGYQFLPVIVDYHLEVAPNGAIIRHMNEREVKTG